MCADLLTAQDRGTAQQPEKLPAYERGKIRPYDPARAYKLPYSIKCNSKRGGNPTGALTTSPEYEPQEGVLLTWGQSWNSLITEMTLEAADAANDSKVFMMVETASMQQSCYNELVAAGVDVNQVVFITHDMNAVWIRDYGPHYITDDGVRAVVNSQYYSSRPKDNGAPVSIADQMNMALYDIPLMYSGGNYLATSNNHAYMSDLIEDDNPGFSQAKISQIFADYQGVDTLHIFPAFPASIDLTGHIDMWMYILSDDKVIIGEYEEITPTYQAYVITENAVTYMQSLGFTVYRVPNYNDGTGGYSGDHYTYTNAFMLNNKVFISYFGPGHEGADREAELTFQAALPSHEIVPVYCKDIIPFAGAIHCISMQVPAYTNSDPAIKVLNPNDGEVWSADGDRTIRWDADDDEEVTSVDLYMSMDGGITFPYVIAMGEDDDGVYEGYDVPYINDPDCKVKAVVHDNDLNQGEDESGTDFTMKRLSTKHYDFSTGANVDKYALGSLTTAWTALNGVQFPAACSTPIDQIDAQAYNKLAAPDATAGGTNNRYQNP
ncbi:MAG: agmatine deiminase family protein, partial [Planctomycetota bacterium]